MNYTRNYMYGGQPVVNQYGLGGFFKSVGKAVGSVAKVALPVAAAFIPGVGGIAAPLVAGLMNRGGGSSPQDQAQQQVQAGTGDAAAATGVTDEALQETMQSHIEQMHARRTDARASVGGGFRYGGALPYRTGGALRRLRGGAVEFQGPSHENGGIRLSPNVEVEGGETMDRVYNKDYVFSNMNTVPGSTLTFAKYHKNGVQRGAGEEWVENLAKLQERVTGRMPADGKYAGGGWLSAAGSWLGNNSGTIASLAPSLLNLGRGIFSSTSAPVMQQIQAQQIEGPSRADFGPVSRSGLDELGTHADVRFNNKEAFARNAAALRTATQGMGTAGRLAALAQARRGNLEMQSQFQQQQDVFNAQRRDALRGQRATLAGQYDLADASNRTNFAQMLQQARTFNAGQRSSADQFNTQADYQNQVGRQQAENARWDLINSAATGVSQYAQTMRDYNLQREANQTALEVAKAGTSEATRNRMNQTSVFGGGYRPPVFNPGINGGFNPQLTAPKPQINLGPMMNFRPKR